MRRGYGERWSDEWESLGESEWERGTKSTRLPREGVLGASVYEIPPGLRGTYHFHHGSEELLVVLRGQATLRTPEGERELAEGDVVHFPTGPAGAHTLDNRTDAPVRYLMASSPGFATYEIAEYPELGKVTAQTRAPSHLGSPLFIIHDLRGTGNELEASD